MNIKKINEIKKNGFVKLQKFLTSSEILKYKRRFKTIISSTLKITKVSQKETQKIR